MIELQHQPGRVFDTGPLRHFALQGWLGLLKHLCREHRVIIPESVEAELKAQSRTDPQLHQVLEADWITIDRSTDLTYVKAFAYFENRLVANGRNVGECGVLALGQTRGYELIIDDRAARNQANLNNLTCHGTLALLSEAIRMEKISVDMVSDLADDLIISKYHLPFKKGKFAQWAETEGLI